VRFFSNLKFLPYSTVIDKRVFYNKKLNFQNKNFKLMATNQNEHLTELTETEENVSREVKESTSLSTQELPLPPYVFNLYLVDTSKVSLIH